MLGYPQVNLLEVRIMKEPLVSRILRYTLYVVFCLGAIVVIALPVLLKQYAQLYDGFYAQEQYRTFIWAFLTLIGLMALWVVIDLIRILRTIPKDPFIEKNVKALKRIGIVAMVMSILFFLKCIYYITFLTFVCAVVLLICSLIVFTLSVLFAQAVRYKEENELTI